MSKQVVLIKFGGSVITDKSIPNSVRTDILNRLIQELKQGMSANPETLYVLGHGSGSFAHVPATQYRTAEGFVNKQSRLGMAITQDSAAQLNRIVVQALLKADLPAVSLYASNSLLTKQSDVHTYYDDVFREYLKNGLLPVVSGDVIVDTQQGCCIWSADRILPFFARKFRDNGWDVQQLIHVTSTPGVYLNPEQPNQGVFSTISMDNRNKVQAAMGETKGFDVTGGMWKKIEEALQLAQDGTESIILSGETPGALLDALMGSSEHGTRITA